MTNGLEAAVPSTFDIVADIIARICHVSRETIALDSNLLRDLGIDSLDLLDVGFALDDAFGIHVPLEQYLIVRELCVNIDTMTATAA
ncbi:MAG TPA: phosphopantetheine-binding protein [Acetobacteraceae bacterium]|jgi:acyl carrier protein